MPSRCHLISWLLRCQLKYFICLRWIVHAWENAFSLKKWILKMRIVCEVFESNGSVFFFNFELAAMRSFPCSINFELTLFININFSLNNMWVKLHDIFNDETGINEMILGCLLRDVLNLLVHLLPEINCAKISKTWTLNLTGLQTWKCWNCLVSYVLDFLLQSWEFKKSGWILSQIILYNFLIFFRFRMFFKLLLLWRAPEPVWCVSIKRVISVLHLILSLFAKLRLYWMMPRRMLLSIWV